jgi:hypothetical protein
MGCSWKGFASWKGVKQRFEGWRDGDGVWNPRIDGRGGGKESKGGLAGNGGTGAWNPKGIQGGFLGCKDNTKTTTK